MNLGIMSAILTRAKRGPFTVEALPKTFSRLQIVGTCNNLVQQGRLVRVRRGKPGRFGAVLTKYALP